MSETSSNETIYYLSDFRHGVDDKRRVQIPAKWRPSQPDSELVLILWPHGEMKEANLLVLPPRLMSALAEKINSMPFADPQSSTLRRLLGRKSASVAVDKAGRVCIPEELAKAAGIGSEAVLVGLVDRFEIWSPERYATVKSMDESSSPEAFKLIS